MIILLFISIFVNIVLLSFLLFRSKTKNEKSIGSTEATMKKDATDNTDTEITDNTFEFESKLIQIKTLLGNESDNIKRSDAFINKIAADINAVQGAFYVLHRSDNKTVLRFQSGYAFFCPDSKPIEFEMGEGLIGQVAKDKKNLNISDVPMEHTPVISGLGKTTTQYLIVCPLIKNDQTIAVMEFSSFNPINAQTEQYISEAANIMAEKHNE